MIAGVHYTIDLPIGYGLTRDDNSRQRWSPPGDGLVVELGVYPRAQTLVDGTYVDEPCPPGDPRISGVRQTIDGVERETDVGIDRCLGPDQTLSCSVGHTRGYLEPDERDGAIALCRHLSVD